MWDWNRHARRGYAYTYSRSKRESTIEIDMRVEDSENRIFILIAPMWDWNSLTLLSLSF